MSADAEADSRIDRLLDAIDFIKADQREEGLRLLRELIREDNDFEDAWLWMSVAVESLDQAALCLDNVLRINPENAAAAEALHRIRQPEMLVQKQRWRARFYRDFSLACMWLLVLLLLFSMLYAYVP
jgi:hypothetical protein